MEQTNCPICFNQIESEYVTECNHTFCIACIYCYNDMNGNNINCPLCRTKIVIKENPYGKKIPFNINNFYQNPNIKDQIILKAYNSVQKVDGWKLLYDYKVNNDTGFMFDTNKEINIIMNQISDDYDGHSGCSMGFTMRELQFIAYYGVDRYIKIRN